MAVKTLSDLLVIHEGLRLRPYDDATGRQLTSGGALQGKITIGVGRNLTDVGITRQEALWLLKQDIATAKRKAKQYKWYTQLNPARQAVIVSMVFNMGSIRSFVKLRQAISVKDWKEAVAQMRDSKWATQIGASRLDTLTRMMVTGRW